MQYTVQSQSAKADADKHAIQGVVGMTFNAGNGGASPAAGLVFAAPVGPSCAVASVRYSRL